MLAAALFAACAEDGISEPMTTPATETQDTLIVGFEGDDTRIQLNDELRTVWNEADLVSVYFYSDANQKWQYQGQTGERVGEIKRVEAGVPTAQTDYVVVAYPYKDDYLLNRQTANLITSLPAEQSYAERSYGAGGNIMVARSEFTQFSLKSVVGWLRISLTGEGKSVDGITLRGNGGEQVAGLVYVDSATAEATLASEMGEASDEEQTGGVGGGLVFDDTIFDTVTLDCGEGVELGAEPTEFYIALLPQTFEQGVTVEILSEGYKPMVLSTEKRVVIERNHIQPMAAVEYQADVYVPENQLWYTATEKIGPDDATRFNVAIVSNEWDETTGKGVITFDGELTTIDDFAFYNIRNLTSITLPDSVTEVNGGAFRRCDDLAQFDGKFATDDGRCLIKDDVLLAYADASGETYTIPEGVTSIAKAAFAHRVGLKSITIGDEVTFIDNDAFNSSVNLMRVNGGNGLETIGERAFYNCGGLLGFTFSDTVTEIGAKAFSSCGWLTSITIGKNVESLGVYVFYRCGKLKEVTLPDGITQLPIGIFCDCPSLESIIIPAGVEDIGERALYDCTNLHSVYCKSPTPPTLGPIVFSDSSIDLKIYVPASDDDSILNAYKESSSWSEYKDRIFEEETL